MRIDFNDYLGSFSVEDLRELAARRRIQLPPQSANARQVLVRTLAAHLARYDSVYGLTGNLNRAELTVLQAVLKSGRHPGLTAVSRQLESDPAEVKPVMDSLRLWGLVFPEGNWEHIAVPEQTRLALQYVYDEPPPKGTRLRDHLQPPPVELVKDAKVQARPGSISRDVAELLARIARSRLKLTQAGRMNRRDLKAMESAFGILTPGYATFLYMLAGSTGLLGRNPDGCLVPADDLDIWLGQPEQVRTQILALVWTQFSGYPESDSGDPADADYAPPSLMAQRTAVFAELGGVEGEAPLAVSGLARLLQWQCPLSFRKWGHLSEAERAASRMARSLYWLGLADVDDPEQPRAARPSTLFRAGMRQQEASLVPEERRFYVQPNAEVFAPPNLSPLPLFHLRRLTGEKKGGAAGMYPLTQESLRRALDTGLTSEQIVTFLERFSRTGLPSNVRSLVETAGRQHGRIRLIPAGYVLVTDEPILLQELKNQKTIAPLLGDDLTERAVVLDEQQVTELVRKLRAKGYAPLDLAEVGDVPDLPEDPDVEVPQIDLSPAPGRLPSGLMPGVGDEEGDFEEADLPAEALDALNILGGLVGLPFDDGEDWQPPEVGKQVTDREEILEVLDYANEEGIVVEAWLHDANPQGGPGLLRFWPQTVYDRTATALVLPERRQHPFKIARVEWIRLTDETFTG